MMSLGNNGSMPIIASVHTVPCQTFLRTYGRACMCLPSVARQEAQRLCGEALKMYAYHGTGRKKDPQFLAQFDLIVTTYGVVQVWGSRFHAYRRAISFVLCSLLTQHFMSASERLLRWGLRPLLHRTIDSTLVHCFDQGIRIYRYIWSWSSSLQMWVMRAADRHNRYTIAGCNSCTLTQSLHYCWAQPLYLCR